jgi:hypothetical protein
LSKYNLAVLTAENLLKRAARRGSRFKSFTKIKPLEIKLLEKCSSKSSLWERLERKAQGKNHKHREA